MFIFSSYVRLLVLNYNIAMQYLKGSDNIVADALWRLSIPETEKEPRAIIAASLTEMDFQIATADDSALPSVIHCLKKST